MEAHVESNHVIGQVAPQLVGRRPANVFGQVGRPDRQHLLGHGNEHERDSDRDERARAAAVDGPVDEPLYQLRIHELEADRREEHDAQQHHPEPKGPQVVGEELEIGFERDHEVSWIVRWEQLRALKKPPGGRLARLNAATGSEPESGASEGRVGAVRLCLAEHPFALLARWFGRVAA